MISTCAHGVNIICVSLLSHTFWHEYLKKCSTHRSWLARAMFRIFTILQWTRNFIENQFSKVVSRLVGDRGCSREIVRRDGVILLSHGGSYLAWGSDPRHSLAHLTQLDMPAGRVAYLVAWPLVSGMQRFYLKEWLKKTVSQEVELMHKLSFDNPSSWFRGLSRRRWIGLAVN